VAAVAAAVTLAELLADAVRWLDRAHIPYMITGSVASTYHGEPRATRDLDIVIDPPPDTLAVLVEGLLHDGYYVDRDAATAALHERTQFNAVGADATNIDFIVRKDRAFSREEFERRRSADLLGTPAFIASVEDMIIAKLEWSVPFESERQLRDVAAMLVVAGDGIDYLYVDRWAGTLGLTEAWLSVQSGKGTR
jgi:hypothetical protein